jgi:hypothetical protein
VTIGENCAKQSRTFADLAEKLKMPVEDLMRQANGHASASKALVKCLAKQLGIDETYLERLAAEVRKDLDSCHGAQRLFWLCQLLLCICTSILGYLFFWTAVLFRLVGQFFGYLLFCFSIPAHMQPSYWLRLDPREGRLPQKLRSSASLNR